MNLQAPTKPALEPEPPPAPKITEAMVIAAEQLAKVEDALQLNPEELSKALSAYNPDVLQAIQDGCSVDEALALVQLDEG